MTTPILSIAEVSQSQSNKEVTINEAIRALEEAMQATRTAAIVAATTLTTAQFTDFFRHVFTGTFGATTVTVPNTQRLFYVLNNTNGNLTIRAGSFAVTVVIEPGQGRLLHCDGSDEITEVGGSSAGGNDHLVSLFLAGAGVDESKDLTYIFTRAVDFPLNLTDSRGHAATVHTGSFDVTITLKKNGVAFGSVEFFTSISTAHFAGSATSFAAGDRLTFSCPAAFETLAGIAITLVGEIVA
jgi:hypothetical protein